MIIVRFIDYLVREQILFKIETEKVVYYQFYPYLYNVSFKFNTNRVANFTTDVPSKHGFQLKDLNRICVYLHYYDKEQNPFYVGQGSVRRAFSFTSRNKLWKEKVIDITKVKVNIFKIDITI